MSAEAVAPWLPIGTACEPAPLPSAGWILGRLGPVPPALSCHVQAAGLEPLPPSMVRHASPLFELAVALIAQVSDLHRAVEAVVGHVHPLKAAPGYDVSHSEPRWRTTAFVSIPERRDAVGALRLAESIVHEAMHLLLTDWEAADAFVAHTDAMLHSPWRGTERAVQGVLHGTFVFACIWTFFSRLPTTGLGASAVDHVAGRLREVSAELGAVDLPGLRTALTPRGAAYLDRWTLLEGPSFPGRSPFDQGRRRAGRVPPSPENAGATDAGG